MRFRKKSHFRTPSRPIQLKIRDDTIRPGAELQNSPFPHRAVRSPDSYTVIILFKSSTSYAISDLSVHATAVPPLCPRYTRKFDRQLSYFLSNTSGTYTIRPAAQVRKSNFSPNRTLAGSEDKLIGIFFCFRTPRHAVSCAIIHFFRIPHPQDP